MNPIWQAVAESAARWGRPFAEVMHLHVLEGITRRVARLPDAERFVLRGSMLTRMLAWPALRPARDLDFVGDFPFSIADTVQSFAPVVHMDGDDGLTFVPSALRARGIWEQTAFPGVRLTLRVGFERPDRDVTIDIGFYDPLVPPKLQQTFSAIAGEPFAPWCCRCETLMGWKLHGLAEKGEANWRPKDLYDLYLLVDRHHGALHDFRDAIAQAFLSRGFSLTNAQEILQASWWGKPRAAQRWEDFVNAGVGWGIPDDLTSVVATVRARLTAPLEALVDAEVVDAEVVDAEVVDAEVVDAEVVDAEV